MRLEPRNVQIIGSELAIGWNDGVRLICSGSAAPRVSLCELRRRA